VEVRELAVRQTSAGQPPPCVAVHAPSLNSASLPLCGARGFRYVTMDFQSVTCETCTALLDGRFDDAARASLGEGRR